MDNDTIFEAERKYEASMDTSPLTPSQVRLLRQQEGSSIGTYEALILLTAFLTRGGTKSAEWYQIKRLYQMTIDPGIEEEALDEIVKQLHMSGFVKFHFFTSSMVMTELGRIESKVLSQRLRELAVERSSEQTQHQTNRVLREPDAESETPEILDTKTLLDRISQEMVTSTAQTTAGKANQVLVVYVNGTNQMVEQ